MSTLSCTRLLTRLSVSGALHLFLWCGVVCTHFLLTNSSVDPSDSATYIAMRKLEQVLSRSKQSKAAAQASREQAGRAGGKRKLEGKPLGGDDVSGDEEENRGAGHEGRRHSHEAPASEGEYLRDSRFSLL